jgi:hypothetical protein
MDGPPGSTTSEVVVGAWTTVTAADGTQQEQFAPCMTIGADRAVTVHGDLIVEGSVLDGDRRPLQLSPSADAFVTAAFLSGVGGASAVLDTFYDSPFEGPVAEFRRAKAAPPDPVDVVIGLAGDQFQLDEFAAQLRSRDPAAADLLRTALDPGN